MECYTSSIYRHLKRAREYDDKPKCIVLSEHVQDIILRWEKEALHIPIHIKVTKLTIMFGVPVIIDKERIFGYSISNIIKE